VQVSRADIQIDSFEELSMPLFDHLYNFAHWLTQNRDEAEDLVQETYAKALKGFSSFQLGTNFRAWMYRILRNTFLTSRTGLRVTMTVPLDLDVDGPELAVACDTPETILFERANGELLRSALEELPVYFREILLLCEVEEMSYQEIAETLSIPVDAVMLRLSRARKMLRDCLRPQMEKGSSHSGDYKGDEPCLVRPGRTNSIFTSMVSFPLKNNAPLTYICAVALRVLPMLFREPAP
jgi:RNA polymerase sigma-70 factor (ECF subfamily)